MLLAYPVGIGSDAVGMGQPSVQPSRGRPKAVFEGRIALDAKGGQHLCHMSGPCTVMYDDAGAAQTEQSIGRETEREGFFFFY